MYPCKAPKAFVEKIGKKLNNVESGDYDSAFDCYNAAEMPSVPVHLIPNLIKSKVCGYLILK